MPSTSNIVRAAVLAGAASAATLDLQPRQTNTCADVHIFLGKGYVIFRAKNPLLRQAVSNTFSLATTSLTYVFLETISPLSKHRTPKSLPFYLGSLLFRQSLSRFRQGIPFLDIHVHL